jgi:DNA-binding transcriptional regulator YiaG
MKDVVYEETESRPADTLEEAFIENKPAKETAKDVAKDAMDTLKELPKVEDLPEEKKKQIREQVKVLFAELNKQPDTSFALRKLMKLWGRLNTELTFQLSRVEVDPEIRRVGLEGKQIIEQFAGKSLDELIARFREFVKIVENDQELTAYMKEVKCYVTEALDKPQITQTEQFYDRIEEYIVVGRKLAKKYRKQYNVNDLVDAANDIINGIQSNEQFSNVQYRAEKLAQDFTTTDIKGNKHLDFDLIKSMRQELLPYLLDRIRAVPIPGFRLSNESFEYLIVDDLYVDIEDVLPDNIRIHSRNDTDLTLKNFENPVKSESIVKVKIEGVRPKFRDFYFKFKRNSILGVSDEGRASLFVTKSGVNIYMEFEITADSNNNSILGEADVKVSVDGITLDILEANHKTLLNIVSPLFTEKLKNQLETSLKLRMKQIAGDWSATINKRFLTVLPTVLPKSPMDGLTTKLVTTVIE